MSGPINPHPPGETPDLLRFPSPERQRRVRIAGAIYLSIGALLAWIGYNLHLAERAAGS